MLKEHDIDIVSFGETKSTRVTALKLPLKFVESESAGNNYFSFIIYIFNIIFTK